ncbi:MAG: hypothetical protein Kow0029_03340 [Candidatus Rifleibacteriota bacterium]
MKFSFRNFNIEDYDEVYQLWLAEPGIKVTEADSKDNICKLLERSPGISQVAEYQGGIVGCVLASEDTRRGYIHHLVVKSEFRHRGLGSQLMSRVEERLRNLGISKIHLFILKNNLDVKEFYRKIGWIEREDISIMSKQL